MKTNIQMTISGLKYYMIGNILSTFYNGGLSTNLGVEEICYTIKVLCDNCIFRLKESGQLDVISLHVDIIHSQRLEDVEICLMCENINDKLFYWKDRFLLGELFSIG